MFNLNLNPNTYGIDTQPSEIWFYYQNCGCQNQVFFQEETGRQHFIRQIEAKKMILKIMKPLKKDKTNPETFQGYTKNN